MKRTYIVLIVFVVLLLGFGGGYALWKYRVTVPISEKEESAPGAFKVIYDLPENQDFSALAQFLQESKIFEEIAVHFNKLLILPFDIPIHFTECGEENAYYDTESRQIKMCYELVRSLMQTFSPYSKSDEELDQFIVNTTFFLLYHEMGHALVDVFEIPTTGKEEDAVDQLATLVLLRSDDDKDEEAALDAASWFFLQGAQKTKIKQLAFWNEHSLDKQRFYDIACLVYGKNPQKHPELVTNDVIPGERAVRCESEYKKTAASWNALLSPHYRQ